MPTYHLEIDLDNAAFWDEDTFCGEALAAALRCCAQRAAAAADIGPGEESTLSDDTGEPIGREWMTE